MADPVWIIDTSSLIEIKSAVPIAERPRVFAAMSALVGEGRLLFPREVIGELRRDLRDRKVPDAPCEWATEVEPNACSIQPSFEDVKRVLADVPDILDPAKESGVDEADPYVLAMASKLRMDHIDARIVTQETKDSPTRLSLNTACGMLGIPSVPLRGFLRAENIWQA